MGRNRTIYQSEAAFASTNATGLQYHASGVESGNFVNELTRVQSAGHSFTLTRQDVNQFGELAAISREIIESPVVNVDMNYLVTNAGNENKLGFVTDGQVSAISGFLDGTQDERNLYLLTVEAGEDVVNNSEVGSGTNNVAQYVTAIGNAFMSNYSVDGAVGQLPNASVTFEALNVNYDPGSSGNYIPAITPESGTAITTIDYIIPFSSGNDGGQVAALRPGDISLQLASPLGADISGEGSAHIQSFSLSVPVAREPLDRLGSRYSFSREITFPVTVTLSVSANMADVKVGSLVDLICADDPIDLAILIREPNCAGESLGAVAVRYDLKNAKLDSESFTSSIGSNKTVDFTWSTQLSGPTDTARGLFISGSYRST